MAHPADRYRTELRWVVMRAKLGGGQQETQDLRVRFGGPSGDEVKQEEHQDTSEEASE